MTEPKPSPPTFVVRRKRFNRRSMRARRPRHEDPRGMRAAALLPPRRGRPGRVEDQVDEVPPIEGDSSLDSLPAIRTIRRGSSGATLPLPDRKKFRLQRVLALFAFVGLIGYLWYDRVPVPEPSAAEPLEAEEIEALDKRQALDALVRVARPPGLAHQIGKSYDLDFNQVVAQSAATDRRWLLENAWLIEIPRRDYFARLRANARDTRARNIARLRDEGMAAALLGFVDPSDVDAMVDDVLDRQIDTLSELAPELDGVLQPGPRSHDETPPTRDLVALLQYRHFGVIDTFDGAILPSDGVVARHALLAGDRLTAAIDAQMTPGYTATHPYGGQAAVAAAAELESGHDDRDPRPEFLQTLDRRALASGLRWVSNALRSVPLGERDREMLYQDPPTSSRELLGAKPSVFIDPGDLMAARVPGATHHTLDRALGALLVGVWLEQVAGLPTSQASDLAQRLRGDRLQIVWSDEGALALHVTEWSDRASASQYRDTLAALAVIDDLARRGQRVAWSRRIGRGELAGLADSAVAIGARD